MNKLIIIRHGECGEDRRLNGTGEAQMRTLAGLIGHHLEGNRSVRLLTSTAPRATDSAEVLAQGLELLTSQILKYELLWSDNAHEPRYAAALELIQEAGEDADVLLVMTHLEYCEKLPSLFAERVLGLTIEKKTLGNGRARLLNLERQTVHLIG